METPNTISEAIERIIVLLSAPGMDPRTSAKIAELLGAINAIHQMEATEMHKKTVTVEIEIPVSFAYDPGEPVTFDSPGALSEVCDIDFDIAEAEAAIWEQLESPEVLAELEDHAKELEQMAKEDAALARGEGRNER